MRSGFLWIACAVAFGVSSSLERAQQGGSPVMGKGKKVCVAEVANSSTKPIATDGLQARLREDLRKAGVNAAETSTVTLLGKHIDLSGNNRLAFRREKCDFMLLTEVALPKASSQPNAPNASGSPNARPSVPNPVSADRLSIDFALFQKGLLTTPVLENSVLMTEPADPGSAALAAIDDVAAQVVRTLIKN